MTVPIEYTAKRYRCPHCRRSYAHRATATKHVGRCFSNPERRTCKTCTHVQNGCCGMPDVYQCYTPWCGPGEVCAKGLDMEGPFCIECGEHPKKCGHERFEPVYGLRVLCDSWEAKP